MQILSSFHDYSLAIIRGILSFITGISLFITTNKFFSNSPIITIIEVIWTVIPIIILICLIGPSLKILYYIEENNPFLTLKAIGHQWYWRYEILDLNTEFESYILPDTWPGEFRLLESDHRIILPTSKDIRVLVTRTDVIHSWAIPRLGVKADAIPGRLNQVFTNITRPRLIYGQCSEICGANHRFIPITIESLNIKYFLKWVNRF